MARLKCNLSHVDTGWGNLRMMNFEVMEVLRRFRCEGIDPNFQMFTPMNGDEDIIAYVSPPLPVMEWNDTAAKPNAVPEGSIPETKKLNICPTCGATFKDSRGLLGHIRFKHERDKWQSSK